MPPPVYVVPMETSAITSYRQSKVYPCNQVTAIINPAFIGVIGAHPRDLGNRSYWNV